MTGPIGRMSEKQLGEMMSLASGADSVELKLTIPDEEQFATARALGIDPLGAQIRQVFFFGTPDLALNRSGLVVRARRSQGRDDDTVIKRRPMAPGDVPKPFRSSPNMKVEVDAMPGGYVCSASLKGSIEGNLVRKVALGKQKTSGLFSKEQRRFYGLAAPEGLRLDDLRVLGPVPLLKLRFKPKGFPGKLVAELWLFPDGSRTLELSTTCTPKKALKVASEARAFLTEKGVDLTGVQETKTKKALGYFAKSAAGAAKTAGQR
jgi:hypothetical protein